MFWYRTAGSACLTAVFALFYLFLRKNLSAKVALFLTAVSMVVYLRTPWEIYYSYLYIAYGFIILGFLAVRSRERPLAYGVLGLFFGLAWACKITIGGMGTIAAIGYFFFLGLHDITCGNYNGSISYLIKSAWTLAGAAVGYLLSFVSLVALGLHVSLVRSFSEIYLGGTKGSLPELIPRPFLNGWKYIVIAAKATDTSSLRGFIESMYNQVTLEALSSLLFGVSLALLVAAAVRALTNKTGRNQIHLFSFFAAVVSGAIAYASAMSNVFDTDSIFITVIFALMSILAFRDTFSVLLLNKVSLDDSTLAVLFGSFAILALGIGFANGAGAAVDSVVWTILLAVSGYAVCISQGLNSFSLAAALLVFSFWYKYNVSTYAWWESNILASTARYATSIGFYAPAQYYRYTTFLSGAHRCFSDLNKRANIYSFPTSTLPYQVMHSLPPTYSVVQHADVFSIRDVSAEFRRLTSAKPAIMFLSVWTPQKMREIDKAFSGGQHSSQVAFWNLLVPYVSRHYKMLREFRSDPVFGDQYNFPQEVWVRDGLSRPLLRCLIQIRDGVPQ